MTMLPIILWLDDERNPLGPFNGDHQDLSWIKAYNNCVFRLSFYDVVWVKSFKDFQQWIEEHGLPDAICFDHDLGEDKTGYDAAKWLVDYCIDHDLKLPLFTSQSDNPSGRLNIMSILRNAKKYMML